MTDSDGNADRVVVVGIAAIGIVHLVTAAWMVIAPRSFFEHIATFGEYNSHFQNDIAAFEAGLGMALLAAVKWPALRIGAVAATFATTTLHAINHWFDFTFRLNPDGPLSAGEKVLIGRRIFSPNQLANSLRPRSAPS